jgi:surface antigen
VPAPPAAPGRAPRARRRAAAAALLALVLAGGTGYGARPAYAAYNCVNVVYRDPYWGQYRRVVGGVWTAAGMGRAFARSGFAVDNRPSAGAIMVWPAGYAGAAGAGHVGVVAAVYGNGTVLVRHENWPFGTPEHVQVISVRPGHQFVHRAGIRMGPPSEPVDEAPAPEPPEAPEPGEETA